MATNEKEEISITFTFEKGLPRIMECVDIAIGQCRKYEGSPNYNHEFLSTLIEATLVLTFNEGYELGHEKGLEA